MGFIGKILLYSGLTILVLGCGPLLIIFLLPAIDVGNAAGFGLLAYLSFWPGIALTSAGILFCVWKYLLDRLPY